MLNGTQITQISERWLTLIFIFHLHRTFSLNSLTKRYLSLIHYFTPKFLLRNGVSVPMGWRCDDSLRFPLELQFIFIFWLFIANPIFYSRFLLRNGVSVPMGWRCDDSLRFPLELQFIFIFWLFIANPMSFSLADIQHCVEWNTDNTDNTDLQTLFNTDLYFSSA